MLLLKISPLKRFVFCLLCSCALGQFALSDCLAQKLVTFNQATSNGLQRAWFAQARVDPARNHVSEWTLANDEIFALTTASTVHGMNAETGKTLWIAQVGNPDYPSVGPAVNSNRVAVLNSSHLYLLDRKDGHVIWMRDLVSAAGAAPALSETFAYVALINGRVEGFPLADPAADSWEYQSVGRISRSPSATGPFVAWPTESGYLYFGNADESKVFFRIETNEEIIAPPVSWGTKCFISTLDGYLYCYDGNTGGQLWRYSTGMPIISKPVVMGDIAYVASEMPALHAVDVSTGKKLWSVDGAVQFVSQAEHHIYATDRYGNLLILDKNTGAINSQLTTADGVYPLVNEQTDRIFLVSDGGLIQCFHEIGADKPTFHRASQTTTATGQPAADQPGSEEDSAGMEDDPLVEGDLFAPAEPAADNGNDPFTTEEPAGDDAEADDDDNPFN